MPRNPYTWAALLSPLLLGALFWRHGLTVPAVVYAFFTVWLLLLSAIDCERLLLPDMLTLPGAVLAVLMCSGQGLPLVDSLLGASVGGVGFWFLARSFPRCLGLGDAKLMLLLGALCGVRGVPMIVAIGSACGLAFALSTGRKRVPFGPCLNLGAYCHMLGVQA